MKASDLHPGGRFVECDPDVYARMSSRDKRELKPATAERFLGVCRAQYGHVHWRTSRGDWCLHPDTPLTRVAVSVEAAPRKASKLQAKRVGRAA